MEAIISDRTDKKRRYATSTLAAAAVDAAVFALLINTALIRKRTVRLVCAAAAAGALSSVLHYQLSSKYVFGKGSRRSAARYGALRALRICCSCGIMGVLAGRMELPAIPVRLLSEACFNAGSYRVMSVAVYNPSEEHPRFYGAFARSAQTAFRLFSRRYECTVQPDDQPVVYVCRHLNMHGPITTLKWLPMDVHPLILAPFFQPDSAYRHLRDYTFSVRWGKKPHRFSPAAWISSRVTSLTVNSLRGIPVHRGSSSSIVTLKQGLRCLKQGESLIVFPDIDYTGSYGKESEIYAGFLYYGEMYYKSTGRPLRFVPLWIDEERRVITAGQPVSVDSRKQLQCAAAQLRAGINGNEALPVAM